MTRRTVTLPDGRRWPVALVRQLIREQRPIEAEQPTLFELRTDARPLGTRNASERYAEPSLFTALD